MADIERRSVGEVSVDGRRLSGVVMRYGEVSPSHRERFTPGALRIGDAVPLNLGHDPMRAIAWSPDGGLVLTNGDDALSLKVSLPPLPAADQALSEIRAGTTRGLSIEFRSEQESRDGDGVRVISAALLTGVGLVSKPSYSSSTVEARGKALAVDLQAALMAVDLSSAALSANMSEADFKDALVAFAQSFPDRQKRTSSPIWQLS